MAPLRRAAVLAALACGPLAAAAPAGAAEGTTVEAQGNPVTGGLAFSPAMVDVAVGDEVTWANTDVFAPHTVVERNGLWSLGGDYGATPLNPPGFAPGEEVARVFEAGTHQYFCSVHGPVQSGVVAVPAALASRHERVARRPTRADRRRSRTIAVVTVRWAAAPPEEGLGFDVERRPAGSGEWSRVASQQTGTELTFRTRPQTAWEVRVRLRSLDSDDLAGEWSPTAAITA